MPAAKWAPPVVARSTCSASPAAAVELELARAAALDQLRPKLTSLCAKAGLRNVPLLSFERWRFAAKWAEDEPALAGLAADPTGGSGSGEQAGAAAAAATAGGGGKGAGPVKKAGSADPVLPYGSQPPAAEPGLAGDLTRAGLAAGAAAGLAQQLAEASAEACARLAKRRHQLVSGKPPRCPEVQLAFHRLSIDLICGGRFVRVRLAGRGEVGRGGRWRADHREKRRCCLPACLPACGCLMPCTYTSCICFTPRRFRGPSTASSPACTAHTGWRRRARPLPPLPLAAPSGCRWSPIPLPCTPPSQCHSHPSGTSQPCYCPMSVVVVC